jgi:DNA-binding NtrC family response regulator
MKILIIDDEIAVAELLADAVEDQGHEAVIARDGVEALALCSESQPDAVFLDILMPGMPGIEVLRQLRARHPSLPVLLVTGHPDAASVVEEARTLGVSDVIEKPFILKQVGGALSTLGAENDASGQGTPGGFGTEGLAPEPA